jgi:hypothetical protein
LRDPGEFRRMRRAAWLKIRCQQPQEALEKSDAARDDWPAKFRPGKRISGQPSVPHRRAGFRERKAHCSGTEQRAHTRNAKGTGPRDHCDPSMHSTQLGIGSGWRAARKPGQSGARRFASAYRTSHSFVCAPETDGRKNHVAALRRCPVNGPMSIRRCTARPAVSEQLPPLVQRETMQGSAASNPTEIRSRLLLLCLVAHYAWRSRPVRFWA